MEKSTIGKRIREFRKRRKISGKDFAELTGFSTAAISKFERGILRPSRDFIEKTITALKLDPEEARILQELEALFHSRYRRWTTSEVDVESNQNFIAEREKNAAVIRSFFNQMIPGLLQSENYMRAILQGFIEKNGNLDEIVKSRKKRQKILSDRTRSFIFVLGEAVLWTCVKSGSVMTEQLCHLISTMDDCSSLELRILPFRKELSFVPISHFVIYDERTIEIEVGRGQIDLWSEEDVKYHTDLMNYLTSAALSPRQSKELITKILQKYKN